tara:strand:- start:148 stop:417 length:270 start_codon:yes stop_codon:yes gene_type:complete
MARKTMKRVGGYEPAEESMVGAPLEGGKKRKVGKKHGKKPGKKRQATKKRKGKKKMNEFFKLLIDAKKKRIAFLQIQGKHIQTQSRNQN